MRKVSMTLSDFQHILLNEKMKVKNSIYNVFPFMSERSTYMIIYMCAKIKKKEKTERKKYKQENPETKEVCYLQSIGWTGMEKMEEQKKVTQCERMMLF